MKPGLSKCGFTHLLSLAVVLFTITSIRAQEVPVFQWARHTAAGPGYEYGNAVTTDALGNVLSTGEFTEAADFNPGAGVFTLTPASRDIFISKLDASGNFVWAHSIGAGGLDAGTSISTDAAGNVYVAGYFAGTVDFDPSTGGTFPLAGGDFILKLDAAGEFVWAKSLGNASGLKIKSSGGLLYLTGYFEGTLVFDGTNLITIPNSLGNGDAFVLKLDLDANLIWARNLGDPLGPTRPSDIAVGPSGEVITTGTFQSTSDFDPSAGGVYNLTSAGNNDGFVSKLDANGNFEWAHRMGSTSIDAGRGVGVDAAGNVTVSGYFAGTVNFDPGGTLNLSSAGSTDIFVVNYDALGDLRWAKRAGGTSADEVNAASVDGAGSVYTTGYFRGTVDFDPGAGVTNLTSAGNQDIFIQKLDASGNFVWATRTGSGSTDIAYAIHADASGNVYLNSFFYNTADFDPTCTTANLSSAGNTDTFIQKLSVGFTPGVASFVPGSGPVGTSVTITGTDFSPIPAINTVRFNGAVAAVTGSTATSVTATVPASATTGPISVRVGCYTGTSSTNFIVSLPTPTITGFAPANGPIGTTVIITGTNFSTSTSSNLVYFGATRALVSGATTTQLTVIVPAGATYQPITVTRSGSTAYSASPFLVTFPDGGTLSAPCSFAPKVDFITGSGSYTTAMGDLDGDGKTDLVVTNVAGNSVSILRNTSVTGTIDATSFAPAVTLDLTPNTGAFGVAIGDLDGDGKQDIVVSNYTSDNISIYRNISTPGTLTTGSFAAKVDFATDTGPYTVAIGDLDVDGKPDIAVTAYNGGNAVSLFRNTSVPGTINAGSFAARFDINTASYPYGLAIGDLDADGKPDLAVTNYIGSSVSLYRNTSTSGVIDASSFESAVDYGVGTSPLSVAIGDLDADGKPEVTVANYASNNLTILKNATTSGAFTAGSFGAVGNFTTDPNPENIVITDLDGDGKPDLATGNQFGPSVSLLKNESTGVITFAPFVEFAALFNTRLAAVGDLDGDGKPDLAVASAGVGSVSVLRNTVSSLPVHTIASFTPTAGNAESIVTISGTNFSTTPLNNTVKFNGVTAVVTAATSTDLTVVVPTGATTGTISVTIGCNTVASGGVFTISCVPAAERNALIALYNDAGGAGWGDNSNWLSPEESTWYGVTVTGCNVTGIDLNGNNLSGTLPVQLGFLAQLQSLNLSGNNLYNSIPSTLGDITTLTELNLSSNYFDNDIPAELGNLVNLEFLDLSHNWLSGNIPAELESMTELVDVYLNNNFLTGSVPAIGVSSTNMSQLYVQNNLLNDLPDFTSYYNITVVDVSNNILTFDDLEPNISVTDFRYVPQAKIPPGGHISFTLGGTLTIPFTTGGTANSYQWYAGGVAIPGATDATLVKPGMTMNDALVYHVEITNAIVVGLTLVSRPYVVSTDPCAASVRTAGELDISFDPNISGPAPFYAVQTQSDGKILVQADATIESNVISGIVRLHSDGSLDNTFPFTNYRAPFVVLPDDRIVATNSGTLVRLNADGTDDPTFSAPNYYAAYINAVAYQSDGKILVSVNEDGSIRLERLNTDGSQDPSFTVLANKEASIIRVLPDDSFLVGGIPDEILHLDADGNVNMSFNVVVDGPVYDLALQSDGKIVVAGSFQTINAIPRIGIARLNADGSTDMTFSLIGISDLGESGSYASKIRIQSDGKIVVAGSFETINGPDRKNIARLNADGSLNCEFDPGTSTDNPIYDIALQDDGKILIVGEFTDYDGNTRFGFARIESGPQSIVTITNVSPASGSIGTPITITGTNFSPTPANNIVYFGATKTTVSAATSTQLTVTVPAGATFEPVTVTVGNLTAYSPKPFIPTFANGSPIIPSSFAAHVDFINTAAPKSINLGDLDGDGRADMVVSSQSGTTGIISVFRNTSTAGSITPGSFAPPVDLIKLNSVREGMALADIDGDGKLEILAVDVLNNRLSVYLNLSTPGTLDATSFDSPQEFNVGFTDSPKNVDVEDLDADGRPDVVTADFDRDRITIVRNISTPGFIDFEPRFYILTGAGSTDISIRDFNSDGKPDLAIANELGNSVSVLENVSVSGTLEIASFSPALLFPVDVGPTKLSIGDIDGDGSQDIITANLGTSNTVSILRNIHSAGPLNLSSFAPAVHFATAGPNNSVELADLNGDGKIDVATAMPAGSPGLAIMQNTSSPGTLSLNAFVAFAAGANSFEVALGDLDNDGQTDIATANNGDNTVSVLRFNSAPTITITLQPSDATVCEGATASFNTAATGALNITYQWQFSPDGVVPFADIADGSGYSGVTTTTLNVSTTGIFGAGRYQCRINGDLAVEVITANVGLAINLLPSAPGTSGGSACGSGSIILNATGAVDGQFRWYSVPTGGSPIAGAVNTSFATPVLTVTTTYHVSIHNGTCESASRTPVVATINIPPGPPSTIGASNCTPAALTLTASGGVNGDYRWYDVATGGTAIPGEVNNAYTTPVISTTTIYYAALFDGTCESIRTPVVATIEVVGKPTIVTSNCTATGATLTGTPGFSGYSWSNGATTQVISVTLAGSYTLTVTSAGGCPSPLSDPVTFTSAFCNQPPVIQPTTVTTTIQGSVTINISSLASDLDNNIDMTTLQVVVQPLSGAVASVNANFEIVVDYSAVSFAGTDELTIQVCDVSGACVQQVITIEVAGDITVYNAISPNGDGKNDVFFIQYIDALPETQQNKVTILNRWGSVVFETTNYNNTSNVFRGLSNNGAELPSGTYYYVLEFSSGATKRTGFISLRR